MTAVIRCPECGKTFEATADSWPTIGCCCGAALDDDTAQFLRQSLIVVGASEARLKYRGGFRLEEIRTGEV